MLRLFAVLIVGAVFVAVCAQSVHAEDEAKPFTFDEVNTPFADVMKKATEFGPEMMKEAVPEIVDVRDVTDHAAGENPYYD